MKIKMLRIVSILGGLLLILQLIYPFILKFIVRRIVNQSFDLDGAASIGIIGGADGPTSIYVASGNLMLSKIFLVACLAMTFVPTIIIWREKQKE